MKKSLALLTFLFFSFALPVFGEDDYTWIGSNGDWAYGPNWNSIINIHHPQNANDNAIINKDGATVKVNRDDNDILAGRISVSNNATLNVDNWLTITKETHVYSDGKIIGDSKLITKDLTNEGTIELTGGEGSITASGVVTNSGTITAESDITFNGAVDGASGTISSANITVDAADDSNLGTVVMAANTSITNSGAGKVTVATLSGEKTATLSSSTVGGIIISAYDMTDVPSIVVAANSKSVSLGGGIIKGLTVNTGSTAAVSSDMTVDGDLVVDGELVVDGDLTVTGKLTVTGSGKLTVNGDLDVTGATKNEGTITTKAAATFASVQIDGGSLVNAGSGAVTATTFTIGSNDASVTNSSTGSITVGTLTGAYKANLDNSSTGSITVSHYGTGTDAPNIVLAASSANVSLAAGSIASLTLGASAQANVAGTLTVSGATNNAGTINAAGITLNFNGAVSGASGTITSSNIKVTSADDSNLGTIAMTATTSITNNGEGKVTVTKLSGEQTAMLSNGATAGGIAISGYDATNVPTIKVASDNISLGAGTIAALTVNESSAAAITGDLTVTGDIDNNGTLTSSSAKVTMTGAAATLGGTRSATFADFAYEPTATTAALTISTANTFDNLTVNSPTGSDVTLTINGAQTLTETGTLDLKGTSGHPLTIEGGGSITLPSTQEGQYLTVAHGGVKILPNSYYYKAGNSQFDDDPLYGMDNNWVLLGDMEFEWTGANGTAWDDPLNWNLNLVPGLASASGGVDTTLYPVTIPDSPSGGNRPIAAAAYTVKSLQVGMSSGAKLELSTAADITVTAASGALVNHGTIVYSSSGRIRKGTAFINDAADGTVEFTSAAGATDLSTPSDGYYNLTISGTGTFTANAALTVTNALAVSDGNANFNGATSVKTASITTTGSLALGNGAGDSFEVTDGALSLPSTIAISPATLTLAGTITASGGITLGHGATLAAKTTFASATTIGAPVRLTGAFTVENTAALTTSAANALTLVNASLENTGAAANGYIVFEGTADQTFTPNAAAYSKVTVNKTSGAFTVDQALKTANLTITQSASAAFGGKVTVTTAFTDAADAGDIAFNAGCAFTPATTFLTNGTVTLNGTSDACAFTAGLEHTAGDTAISGNLTTTNAAITLGATTLAADTTINAGSGAVEINGTLNGAKAITSSGSGALTLAGAVGGTTPPTTITATGPTIVTAPSITTSGAQTYKDNLTFNADCAVTGPVKMTGATATLAGTGKATFTDFTAANATSLTIENDNSFTKFSCTKGGATLTINGAQTITGTTGSDLTLKGADGSLITIKGNGSIKLSKEQSSGQYLKVTRDSVAIQSTSATDRYFIAKDSQFDSDPLYGMNNNWVLLGQMDFVWTGATSDDWGTASNWNHNLVPGLASASGGVDTRGYPVTISNDPAKTHWPETGDVAYSVGQLTIDDADSKLTLSSKPLAIKLQPGVTTTADGTLTNKGTIVYSDAGRITDGTTFINDAAHGGTVEFAGASDAADLSTPTAGYYNLTISGTGTFTANAALTVTNALTVSDGNANFNGATSVKTASITTTGSLALGNGAGDSFTVTNGALSLPSTIATSPATLTLAGTITASGGITLGHDATLAANTTFASATTIGAPVRLTGAFTVENTAALTTDATNTLTLVNASLKNTDAAASGYIVFEGTADQTFTPNAAAYSKVTVNKTSGAFTVDQALKTANLTITQSASAAFGGKVTVTTAFTDAADAGDIAFNAGCSFTPATTFATTGTLTLNDATNPSTTCAFTAGLTHMDGPTVLSDTISTTNAAITLGNTTLAADTTIDAGTGTVTLGDISGAKELTFENGGTLALTGTVAASKITMTGAAPTLTGSGNTIPNFVYDPNDTTDAGLTVSGSSTFTNFTCEKDGAKIAIGGANTFSALTVKSAGGTLAINGAQTITGTTGSDLTLKGADGSLITINGNGSIKLSKEQSSGQYLKVTRDSVAIQSTTTTDRYFIAKDSQFDSNPLYGMNNNWIILNSAMVFEWTGATSTAWGDRSNWNYNLIPGTAHGLGSGTSITVDTKNYDVKIPNSPTGVSTNFPVVTAEQGYSVGNLTIDENTTPRKASVTINTVGNTDPADKGAIKIYAGKKLTNYGTIIYQKTGRVTQGNVFYNDADTTHKGTVVFDTGSAAADLADVAYYDLIVSGDGAFSTTAGKTLTVNNDMTYSGGGSLTLNDSANISNDLTISGTGTFTANAALTVTNALTASNGSVNFNASSDATETKAGSADFTPASSATLKLSLGNTAGDKFTLTGAGSALVLPAGLNALTLAGTITAPGGITLAHGATLADNTIFASATTIDAPVKLTGAFTVENTAALTTTNTLTLVNASLKNTGAAANGYIIFEGTAPQTFTPNTAAYSNITVNKTSGAFTVDQALETANLTIAKNESATFGGKVTVTTSYTDAAAAGDIAFNAGCSFTFTSPVATFLTSRTLALAGTPTACAFTSGLTHTAGMTMIKGQLNTTNAAITLGKTSPDITTTLADDTTINAGSGAVSINGTLNGAHDLTSNGTGLVTFGGTVGTTPTTEPTKITTAGSATFNAATNVNGPVAIADDGEFNGTTTVADDISIDGNAEINGATTTTGSGKITIGGNAAINANTTSAATITVTGETTVTAASITTPTDPATGLQLYKDNLTFNSDCTISGNVQAAANVATSGAAKATFNNELWLYTNAGNAKDSTLGGGSASPSLDIKGNLFIAKTGQAATVASAVSAQNILLLHGTLNVNAALSSTKDIILLGSAYNIADSAANASGVTNLFAYNHASRKCAASYTDAFPTSCPDGPTISTPYTGTVAVAAGLTVTASQNFYANGLSSITGSGEWNLELKDNNKQTDAFAEIYNSTITNCSANYKVAAAENVTATGCTNITTTRPVIFEAYTVYDDVVYISFKDSAGNAVKIENSGNEISAAAANILNSAGAYAALATYKDADCQTTTNGKGDIDGGFYIKSDNKWNTDANGINAGADQSTDRGSPDAAPAHRTTIPYLNLPKALSTLYETLRDDSKNRIAHYGDGHIYTAVADKCAPVLIKVLSGQEIHESPATQKDYDAHNFVEFVYSEPVDIASVSGGTTVAASDVNVQAAADLGHATGASGITFAGLATTASGKINASLKTGSGSPHALYRNFSDTAGATPVDHAARVRVSIAGWVDGTVAGSYKNWAGYISSAKAPSGNITRIANANIKDKSPAQNSLDANPSRPNHALPPLTVQISDGAANELYGTWDVTPPSFAPVRINGTTTWANPHYDGSQEFEYVGASYGTGTLSAIEVHWFDNEPDWTENLQWFSRVGWGPVAASGTEYSSITSYAADVRGGSRPDTASANATAGGIRYCSLYNAYNAFKYSVVESGTYHDFTQNIQGGAESSLFTYAGTASGTHTTGAEDGLYCKLILDDTSLQPKTTFLMKFDSNACYITDLAGNRIQCGNITIKSVDRTPPEYLMTAVPLGTKQMLIIFSKELNIDTLTVYDSASVHHDYSALEYIPKALELTGGSGPIAIDQSVPATCVFRNDKATGIVVTLSQNAVLNDITRGIKVNAIGVNKYDPLAGIPATITYIQDSIGNYLVPNKQHALSDFAVNAVNPQYAYDNTLTDGGVSTDYSLYQEGAWAVRDWNAEQNNYGTLSAAKEYIMQTTLYDGTNDNTGGAADFLGTSPTQTITSFFDSAPDANSVSTKINENTRLSWRIWHPNSTPDYVFTSLATINNVPQFNLDGSANDSGVVFDIPQSVSSAKWKSGDQVSFLFKMGNYTVDHFDDGTAYPLYAVRLKDPNDITSLDLWSFKIKTTSLQRGGVSILNNVIDLNTGEHTVIQVDMKQSGNLNVIVMTLDGNIVTYLRHGQTDAGTHYYNWNGTNNGGSKVARGLYFVRVIGPGIDETRKVMCVK